MKFAVYIVDDICKRMEGARGRYLDYFCTLGALKVNECQTIEGARGRYLEWRGPEAVTSCTLGALKTNAVMSNHRI